MKSFLVVSLSLLIAAPLTAAAASTNFEGSVHFPPGGSAAFAGTAAAISDQISIQWFELSAPSLAAHGISMGAVDVACAAPAGCHVEVHGSLGGELAYDLPAYPYSVYAIELKADASGPDLVARLLVSGVEVWNDSLAGEDFGVLTDLVVLNADLAAHVFIGPLRLWSVADPDPWLFGHPAPSSPGLVGSWRVATRLNWQNDVASGPDGALVLARPAGGLCWEASDLRGFADGFESGDVSRWSLRSVIQSAAKRVTPQLRGRRSWLCPGRHWRPGRLCSW